MDGVAIPVDPFQRAALMVAEKARQDFPMTKVCVDWTPGLWVLQFLHLVFDLSLSVDVFQASRFLCFLSIPSCLPRFVHFSLLLLLQTISLHRWGNSSVLKYCAAAAVLPP